jgi:UDP-2-acetamido-3-amino-2,3-dideoxy-glucuronate N-acetyltransferase
MARIAAGGTLSAMPHHDPKAQPRIHPTAIVEPGASVGHGTSVWDAAHLRSGARVGSGCIVGEKTYVAGGAVIGDLCKLNANVYVCAGVTIEDGAMVAAHTVFTNDRAPRACDPELRALLPSEPGEQTLATTVRRGASIGANCTIGPGLELGEFCMVGMGSVVTRDVPAHGLVVGNPARLTGAVCRCGEKVATFAETAPESARFACASCGRHTDWHR